MDKRYIVIIIISVISIFFLSIGIAYTLTTDEDDIIINQTNNNDISNKVLDSNNEIEVEKKDEYKQINKDSAVAQELFDFVPKTYQTYPYKMSEDYMIYEAVNRLASDDNVETITVGEFYGYKYSDVELKLKEIYGDKATLTKKDKYDSPIEYIESSNAFCVYPYGLDNTDNIMVIKSVEENSEFYKVTVYSVCAYMDMNSNDYDSVYIITKDTMGKYYATMSRNDSMIVSTYKKYELNGQTFNPEDVVNKYESYLPQIEFYIKKIDDMGTKYYISDIKDIY